MTGIHILKDNEDLATLKNYPMIVAVPAAFKSVEPSYEGQHTTTSAFITPGTDPKVIGAVYKAGFNRLDLTVENAEGLLQTYRAGLSVARQEARNKRTLTVTIHDLPRLGHAGKVVDIFGKTRKLRLSDFTRSMDHALSDWLANLYQKNGIPDADMDKLPKGLVNTLDFSGLQHTPWYDEDQRRRMAAARVVSALLNGHYTSFTLDVALAHKFIPELPVIDVPYRVFRSYNKSVYMHFMGVMQLGGAPNNTLNARTANRISVELGEEINHEDLLQLLKALRAPHLLMRPDTKIFCLGVVTKGTKEAK